MKRSLSKKIVTENWNSDFTHKRLKVNKTLNDISAENVCTRNKSKIKKVNKRTHKHNYMDGILYHSQSKDYFCIKSICTICGKIKSESFYMATKRNSFFNKDLEKPLGMEEYIYQSNNKAKKLENNFIKIYLDDIRETPKNYIRARSVNECKEIIEQAERDNKIIEVIDCDHDLGDFAFDGGDGIKLLDWLIERNTLYHIQLHTQNPVGRENMQRTIDRYWKKED